MLAMIALSNCLPTTVVNFLAIIGLILSVPVVYRFASFIWIYFIRSSSVNDYLTGPAPYALITGATDGIGKAVAKQLYRRGFVHVGCQPVVRMLKQFLCTDLICFFTGETRRR